MIFMVHSYFFSEGTSSTKYVYGLYFINSVIIKMNILILYYKTFYLT